MSGSDGKSRDTDARRKARLAEALKVNLRRRKAQARSRQQEAADPGSPHGSAAPAGGNDTEKE